MTTEKYVRALMSVGSLDERRGLSCGFRLLADACVRRGGIDCCNMDISINRKKGNN